MSEKVQISRQQQKSRETREKIFQAAKRILQKEGYEALSIIILRRKMICFLTILRISRRLILIF